MARIAFVGRERELQTLTDMLDEVRRTGSGVLLTIRGRRRVGKSRLVDEWCKRQGVSHVFYESTRERHQGAELALFAQETARSSLVLQRWLLTDRLRRTMVVPETGYLSERSY
ncbi:MAG: AAA family ATPase, partial [Chloroflexota bacterium]